MSGSPCVCPVNRQQQHRVAGLLLSVSCWEARDTTQTCYLLFLPHRAHLVPFPTHVARKHGLCVLVCWTHVWALQSGWTDQDTVLGKQNFVGTKNRVQIPLWNWQFLDSDVPAYMRWICVLANYFGDLCIVLRCICCHKYGEIKLW